jgi:phosphoenolpyruvate carboxykinase (GTP)
VGVVRRDPMAMLPFCGYNMGHYFRHWLDMGKKMSDPPKIFHVNWFRTNAEGKFLWPGFGENLRVLDWMLRRAHGETDAVRTPIGFMPREKDIVLEGTGVSEETLHSQLLNIDRNDWLEEIEDQNAFFSKIGDMLPQTLREQQKELHKRLG